MRVRALALLALCTADAGCHVYNADLLDAAADRVAVDTALDSARDGSADADACATMCGSACADLQTDVHHCGRCDVDCTTLANVAPDGARCVAGVCDVSAACTPGHAHCSASALDGCEADISTAAACGSCGHACPPTAPVCSATSRDAGMTLFECATGCDPGSTLCETTCTDVTSDADNCGLCGRICTAGANGTAVCNASMCGIACNTGFGDCDGDVSTGCERNLASDLANCGACANRCPTIANGAATCSGGTCGASCTSGFGDCDGDLGNGCESNFANDPAHCGSCANACSTIANATATCTASVCGFVCNPGFTLMAGRCVLPAPRLRAPLSTTYVTRQRPSLTAILPTGADGVRVEICSDRACTTILETIDATGPSAQPTMALAPGAYYWRAYARSGSDVVSPVSNVWLFHVTAHDTGPDTSWGSRPDLNADGLFDVVVGGSGAAWLFSGARSGLPTRPTTQIPTPAGATQFGNAVAGIGDVNGDGFGDIAIAAFGSSNVYIYFGAATTLAPSPSRTLTPPGGSATFGISVSGAGDVNGDGYADLLVGASGSSTAYVYYGSAIGIGSTPATTLVAGPTGSMGGRSVASAGDVNGDGVGDVIVGSPAANEARVFLGRAGAGLDPSAPIVLSGPASSSFGRWVAGAGDGNGDGFADVLVSAPGGNTAFVYLGSSSGPSPTGVPLVGPSGSTTFGNGADLVPDADGDGFDEVVVGASGNNVALVWRGNATMAAMPTTLSGPPLGNFGSAVAGAGDVNGDQLGDLVIGAPNSSQAIAYYGGTPVFGTSATITATTLAAGFGQSLAVVVTSPRFHRRDPG
jgi:hypothetical protein